MFGLLKRMEGVEVWMGTGGDICDFEIILPPDEGMESVRILGSSIELLIEGVVLFDGLITAESFVHV